MSMHVVTLPLRTTKDDTHELAKRYRVLAHIHNVLVKHAKRLLDKLASNTVYQAMLTSYKEPAKTPQLAAGMKAGFSFLDIYV